MSILYVLDPLFFLGLLLVSWRHAWKIRQSGPMRRAPGASRERPNAPPALDPATGIAR